MYRCLNPGAIGIKLDWEACLPLARESGFEGIDVAIDPKVPASKYREALDRYRLAPGGAGLPVSIGAPEADFAKQLQALDTIAGKAKEIGLERFATWILPHSDALTYKENFQFHAERLGRAARLLEQHGCRLGLEFIGPRTMREGHRYTFAHTLEQMLELCEEVGPNAGLLLDSWHWYASLGTVDEILALKNEQVVYVHINDAPAGIPIEQHQDNVRRIPGETGVIDLASFLGALRRIGYDGPVVPEPFVPSLAALPAAEAASRVGKALKSVWDRAPAPALPAKMRALATGRGKAWLVDLDVPKPEGNQVVVKLHASPICGSNMGAFRGDGDSVNVGHEGAGEVVAVAQSNLLRVGDRVALAPPNACGVCASCRAGEGIFCQSSPAFHGTFAQFTKVSDSLCTVLPADIDYERGSLLGCCLGPAFRATKALRVGATDELVVAGLGPVGLGAVALGAWFGARVIALDPEPYRRELATKLGASRALDPREKGISGELRSATEGRGLLKGIECSGEGESERLLIDAAGVGAAIAFVGENQGTIAVSPSNDFIRKGLTIIGCWHMNTNDAPLLFPFLRHQANRAKLLISHRFSLGQAQEAFDVFASRRSAKVILRPWE